MALLAAPFTPDLLLGLVRSLLQRLNKAVQLNSPPKGEEVDGQRQLQCHQAQVASLLDELVTLDATWLGQMTSLPSEEEIQESLATLDPTDFDCKLCFSMVHYPVALPCGHVFCHTCVERFLDHKPSCPVCRTPLPRFLAEHDYQCVSVLHELTHKLYPEALAQRDQERQAELDERRSWIPVFVCNTVCGYAVSLLAWLWKPCRLTLCLQALPSVRCPLHVFEPRYRLMLRRVMESEDKTFGMCEHTEGEEHYSEYGTLLKVNDYKVMR